MLQLKLKTKDNEEIFIDVRELLVGVNPKLYESYFKEKGELFSLLDIPNNGFWKIGNKAINMNNITMIKVVTK